MEVQFWAGEKMVFLNTPDSRDILTLQQVAPEEPVGSGGGISHFGFGLQDRDELDTAVQEVIAAGGTLVDRGEHAPGAPYAYFTDPDGYVIEL